MAKNNTNVRDDEESMKGIQMSPLAFNKVGLYPTSVKYEVDCDTFMKWVTALCDDWFGKSNYSNASIVPTFTNPKKGEGFINVYVWFKWDSPHIVSTELMDVSPLMVHPLQKWSKELKDFMAVYVKKENQRLYIAKDAVDDHACRGIKVDLHTLFCDFFDQNNVQFKKTFNAQRAPRTRIIVRPHANPETRVVKSFTIIKELNGSNEKLPVEPRSAFRAD